MIQILVIFPKSLLKFGGLTMKIGHFCHIQCAISRQGKDVFELLNSIVSCSFLSFRTIKYAKSRKLTVKNPPPPSTCLKELTISSKEITYE